MDVTTWLTQQGLEAYAEAFAENGVDAALLPELTNEDLKDLGVARLADRKRLLKAISQLSDDDDWDDDWDDASQSPADMIAGASLGQAREDTHTPDQTEKIQDQPSRPRRGLKMVALFLGRGLKRVFRGQQVRTHGGATVCAKTH